ncbi:MAG: hypothetical protein P794_09875 [Epsilonproteobacteria bacterium (ex Lamellibrachia satsuma)]|nr:MAG: hypothetical protein P794_09875 [Epsilonproteobacteria bacterium (ex Lamellibrachia satsuma)]
MKAIFLPLFLLTYFLSANQTFEPSETCKKCHPAIYKEFQSTQHSKASIFDDEIHAAVWKKHPKNRELQSYTCAKCHTPAASNIDELVKINNGVVPDVNSSTQREGISCAYCHRIESIKHDRMMNINVISKEEKSYFGSLQKHIKSPFHKIKTNSAHFNNGNACIGCHSHKKNKFDMNVCSTNVNNELEKANCVSCHMPKVEGSISTLHETKEHTFHGFPGTHSHQDMLSKYAALSLQENDNGFDLLIENKSSHALSLHPMRVMQIRVKVTRAGKIVELERKNLAKIIGADGKPTPPWLAKEVVKDTAIKGNEKRILSYGYTLEKDDKVDVTIGYYLVNPKMLKGLGLKKSKVATKFNIFKTKSFEIKK